MKPFLLEPLDILFFRDGRPMAAGQGSGHGCRLPLPSTLHEAVRTALLYHTNYEKTETGKAERDFAGNTAFQSLGLHGPFLYSAPHGGVQLPLPLDVVVADRECLETLKLREKPGQGGWKYLPVSPVAPSKDGAKGYWNAGKFANYLTGRAASYTPTKAEHLFVSEERIGVEIDDHTQATAEGRLYSAAYLRPQKDTQFWFEAGIADTRRTEEAAVLDNLGFLLLGGDRRLARVWNGDRAPKLNVPRPNYVHVGSTYVKWVLLSPAIFSGGHLPGWLMETAAKPTGLPDGVVRFDVGRAELVSVCIGKPIAVSGWDVQTNLAKPTRLAVPAGGVYYFECDTPQTAEQLATALHWRTRSDFFGEKGFGLGVCGVWEKFPDVAERSRAGTSTANP